MNLSIPFKYSPITQFWVSRDRTKLHSNRIYNVPFSLYTIREQEESYLCVVI